VGGRTRETESRGKLQKGNDAKENKEILLLRFLSLKRSGNHVILGRKTTSPHRDMKRPFLDNTITQGQTIGGQGKGPTVIVVHS